VAFSNSGSIFTKDKIFSVVRFILDVPVGALQGGKSLSISLFMS